MAEAHAIGGWPIVGRAEELALIGSVAGGHDRRSVVIAGRSGVGKTALARAAVERLGAHGWPTAWVTGTRTGAEMPFGAVAPLLPRRMPGSSSSEAGLLVDTLRLVRDEIVDRAGPAGLVLGVDDAQWLDDASAVLVQQLASLVEVSAVITIRSGEPVPDPVTSLWKNGEAVRLELEPLDEADLRVLLQDVLGGVVDPTAAAQLIEASAGNVLFLRELVRAARDQRRLVLHGGRWLLHGPVAPSSGLIELVEARVGEVAAGTRSVLELLAVEEPLPLAIAEVATDATGIDDAVTRELAVIELDRRRAVLRLAHPLYGDALRARLTVMRTRTIARQLADLHDEMPRRRVEDAMRAASWRLAAGDRPATATLAAAARDALALGDAAAAERFGRSALDAAPDDVATRLVCAEAAARSGRIDEAVALLDDAVTDPTSAAALEVAELRGLILFVSGSDTDEAIATLAEAEARCGSSPRRWRLRALRAQMINAQGWPARALAVIDDPADPCPPEAQHLVDGVRAPALAFTGRFGEAEATLGRRLAPDPSQAGSVGPVLFLIAFARGDLGVARQLAALMLASPPARRDREIRDAGEVALGWVSLAEGDIDGAIERFLHQPGDGSADFLNVRAPAVGGLLACYLAAGRVSEAAGLVPRIGEPEAARWSDGSLLAAQAMWSAGNGEPTEARTRLVALWEDADLREQRVLQMFIAAAATAIAATDLSVPWFDRLGDLVEGPLVQLNAAHARAQHAGDGATLDQVSRDFEAIGMLSMAARTASIAAVLHDGTDPARALAARRRTTDLLTRCPGLAAAFIDEPRSPVSLTDREREVARLAAAGMTSADIAERLYVSVRTVDSHLGRVYSKLGITGRGELPAVARLLQP